MLFTSQVSTFKEVLKLKSVGKGVKLKSETQSANLFFLKWWHKLKFIINKLMQTQQRPFYQNYPQVQHQPLQANTHQPIQQVFYSNKKLEHINCVLPPTQQAGGLFIGDTIATLKQEYLTENKIEAILCLNAEAARNVQLTRFHIDFRYMEVQDHADYPIKLHFDSAYDFIQKNIKNKKNVLVQCHAGVSRSATIVCAYLIRKKSWIPQQAIYYLKQKRSRAKPNAGFWKQVDEYWMSLSEAKKKDEQINLKTPTKSDKFNILETPSKQAQENKSKSLQKQLDTTVGKSETDFMTPKQEIEKKQKQTAESEKKNTIFDSPLQDNRHKFRQSESLSKAQNPYEFFRYHQNQQNLVRPSAQQFHQTFPNMNHFNNPIYQSPAQIRQVRPHQILLSGHPQSHSQSNFYPSMYQHNWQGEGRKF